MTQPPASPNIYHITHVDNLPSILDKQGLRSDSVMLALGGPTSTIGMGSIKKRRLELPVKCYSGDTVGNYVPFYFCPRSIMLYLIHMANHADLAYRGGQGPIVHLEADLHETMSWAAEKGRRCAFTLSNAGAAYAEFRKEVAHLNEINWEAVMATDFRPSTVKEGKQAEFLLHEFFPWPLVRRIGVQSPNMHSRVVRAMAESTHRPPVEVLPNWYF